ncbi:MAG: hypothetical protein WC655_10465, partial [Candidatus Hydrogenedentales bacterium]
MASGNDHSGKHENSGCGKGCLGILAAGLVLLLVLVLGASLLAERMQGETDVRIQAIRDAGEPASFADIAKWIGEVEDSENAAIPLQTAIDAHREPSDPESPIPFVTKVESPKPTEPLSQEMKTAIAAYLKEEE